MDRMHGRWLDYREHVGIYPSQQFFLERLQVELERPIIVRGSWDEIFAQLEEVWNVPDRKALVDFIAAQLKSNQGDVTQGGVPRLPVDILYRLKMSLRRLTEAAEHQSKGDRYKADLAVLRLSKFLSASERSYVLEPWFHDLRPQRTNAVMACFRELDDLSPVSEILIKQYEVFPSFDLFRTITRDKTASAGISKDMAILYFGEYSDNVKYSKEQHLPRGLKYRAMVGMRMILQGGHKVNNGMRQHLPEIIAWAICDLGDPEHEPLLMNLLDQNPNDAHLIWTVIRGAPTGFLPRCYHLALDMADRLLESRSLPPGAPPL